MDQENLDQAIAQKSARIYLSITFGAALLFYIAASLIGEYPLVARIGGVVWVSLLTLIISMPLITSSVKKKLKARG